MLETAFPKANGAPSSDRALEQRLERAIEPWLTHMKWREDFDAWRQQRIWQERYQNQTVADVEQILDGQVEGKTLLDLGSGMGGLSVALMLRLGPRGLSLQAMDYNPAYCEIARLRAQRYGRALPVAVAAGEQLPYPAGAFDCVVCLDVLEHVADATRVLGEIYRTLRPGAVAVATVPNRHAFRDPHYHLPFINWLPRPLAERIVIVAGRSKGHGILKDRQQLSELNTYSWGEFRREANRVGFVVRDRVYHRIVRGEIRKLGGWRRRALRLMSRSRLLGPIYRIYRYGWQGTYQILLLKPR